MDKSKGRFLALYKGFLDVAIYRRGREVTIGGKIIGKRVIQPLPMASMVVLLLSMVVKGDS
ncbi:MAG: Slp family lipoprotein [Deltaproteobacteria bacterium]|nr:Slp family lipoprotein [Deltaproteobacteria bacterium]